MMTMILTAAAAAICVLLGAFLYRRGLKDGLSITKTGEVAPLRQESAEVLPEDEETKKLLAAIEAYDGTGGEV